MHGASMHFFLYEIVARVVAAYLFVDCFSTLKLALAERKIRSYNPDLIASLLDWSRQIFDRDTMPIRYWMEMTIQTLGMIGCFVTAIIGWWQPNA